MKARFSVPYICEPDYLDGLFSAAKGRVSGVYVGLPSGCAGSGRAVYYRGLDYKRIAKVCHEHGAKLEVLLNASCEGLEPYTAAGLERMMSALGKVVADSADVATVANPLLMQKIKDRFDVEVKVSVMANVRSVQRASFFERMGADAINLDRDINRDLALIKRIREAVDCDLFLLANEGCLLDCPFKHSHDTFIGHLSKVPPNQRSLFELNPFAAYCTRIKQETPEEILKSPWIRPEDLGRYGKLVDGFKLAGRELSAEDMLRIVGAYAKGRYDGNLMDLLNVRVPGLFIDNRSLDNFVDKAMGCKGACRSCDFCRKSATKLVKRI
jgi:collagenase-like PrtC family protease